MIEPHSNATGAEPGQNTLARARVQRPLVVLKFGSSVLGDGRDLSPIVSEIYRWMREGNRVLAVVSALAGVTDRLLAEARALGSPSDNPHVGALAALGEEESAARLALACDRAGLNVLPLRTPDLGIGAQGHVTDARPTRLRADHIREAFLAFDVVIAPGFVAHDQKGRIVLLGRGGSDLTAVFLGRHLGADRIRLLKDVDGVYDHDPATYTDADRFAALSWKHAREIAGELVQSHAMSLAAAARTTIEIAALGAHEATSIGDTPDRKARAPKPRKLRVAVGGRGIVGGGVLQRLMARPDLYDLVGVCVRDPDKSRDVDLPRGVITPIESLLERQPDVIIDTLSDTDASMRLLHDALESGVHAVTANKQAMARAFQHLGAIAARNNAMLRFSACMGGAAPIVETIRAARAADASILSVEAIVSGSMNYLLTQASHGVVLADALAKAARLGLVEEDARMDLEGHDAVAKLRLIGRLAFDAEIAAEHVARTPLTDALAEVARHTPLRQVARILRRENDLRAEVTLSPAAASPFAEIEGDRNAVLVTAADGRTWCAGGRGAGRWPTTESVLADLGDIARHDIARTRAP